MEVQRATVLLLLSELVQVDGEDVAGAPEGRQRRIVRWVFVVDRFDTGGGFLQQRRQRRHFCVHQLQRTWRTGKHQRLLRERHRFQRHDSAIAERRDHRTAYAFVIVRGEFAVRGDQRTQEIGEPDVDRGQVLDGADAHVEDLLGDGTRG